MLERILCIALGIVFVVYTPLIGYADSYNNDELVADLMAAELYCFNLESLVFELKEDFKSRNDVYEFFRQGFGPLLAEKLTDNIWVNDKIRLKPGDKIMKSPDTVNFKSISPNSAVISFKTPENRTHIWGNSEFTDLVLKKEGDRWKLFQK